MRLPQLETTRLYRRIAELLETRIDQGLFPVGTFLPSERELAEQLGVSRTSVREALIALEVTGRVDVRQGHGVEVLAGKQRSVRQSSDLDIGPIQILEARRVIEPRIAELAAANHRKENLDAMRAAMALQASAASATAENYREGDREFHLEIARASGNPAYQVVVDKLWEYRTKPLFERFERLLVGPDRPRDTATEHEAIYAAIEAADTAAAGRAMKQHLDAVLSAFIKGSAAD
ncbi:FadR/GntR family transcriptional regulator [Kaistia sp. 32K]|uniref:FadR/GntR family transcriptional regulator n=1 Tax=Kaistia sp. 32K TaxID=2795690 RepID=UPI0019151AEA|nr:FCD domain-containing protein [Kaistia sp. 32K]